MKQNLLQRFFATLMLFVITTISWAYDFEKDGIFYNINPDRTSVTVTYKTTSYNSYPCSFDIPSTVTYGSATFNVTSIGENAFRESSGLTSITIPNSVTSIGENAFSKCSGLTSVTIPNSVTSIGNSAFYKCNGLTSITIPNSVTSIGRYAFYYCSSLTSVTIGNSVTSIGYEAFYKCSGLKSITIGNSVTSIGNDAFYGCSGLTFIKVEDGNQKYDSRNNCNAIIETSTNTLIVGCKNTTIPNSVTRIGNNAFGRRGLTSITIPNSVTIIEDSAFCYCEGLTSVTIPNSVTSIGNSAFDYCEGLTSVTIGNSVTCIGERAFYYCSSLTSVNIPNCVTSIGESTFNGCSSLKSVTIPNSVTSIGESTFNGCSSLKSVTIPNSVTSIGDFAFNNCSELTTVTIPNNVASIGIYAFHSCSGLTSVTIGNSVISIGEDAFNGCVRLTSMTIGDCVSSIGNRAFYGCSNLTSISLNSNEMLSKTWREIINLTTIFGNQVNEYILGDGVKSIGDYAFYNSTNLTSITISNSVTNIGENAFTYCNGLTSITIPNSVISIGKEAFYGCSGLNEVYCMAEKIPSTGDDCFSGVPKSSATLCVPSSSVYAYKNASQWKDFGYILSIGSVTAISISQTSATLTSEGQTLQLYATVIPSNAINKTVMWSSSNTNVATVDANGLVKAVASGSTTITVKTADGSNKMATCTVTVSISNGIDGISYIFNYSTQEAIVTYTGAEGSHLSSYAGQINIPSTVIYNNVRYTVTSIGEYAFNECVNLTSVTIPETMSNISSNAFYGCSSLTTVLLNSNEIASKAYTSSSNLKNIFGSQVKEYILGDDVKNIGEYTFYYCSRLTTVTIGNNVTSIGNRAFYGCSSLTTVLLNSNEITSKVYTSSSNLKNIFGSQVKEYTIGEDIKSIGNNAFYGCNSLTKAEFASIESVCKIKFGNSDANPLTYAKHLYVNGQEVTDLVIPNSVTSIGKHSFCGCSGLISATIPHSVISIGESAFAGCSGLISLVVENTNLIYDSRDNCNAIIETGTNKLIQGCKGTCIPNTVTSIGQSAFQGCSGLTSVTIPNSVTSIGTNAFSDCSSLTSVTINSNGIVSKTYTYTYTYGSNLLTIFGSQVKEYILGSEVKSIGDYAFYECHLTSITIPNSVTSIGYGAFSCCSGLKSITIPNSVTSIGTAAFSSCTGLTKAEFASIESLCKIKFGNATANPLYNAKHLCINGQEVTDLVIPNSVTSIGKHSFCGCSGLISATIPNSVTSIGNSAFDYCEGLTSVTIGNSVTSIGSEAFFRCSSLTSIKVEAGNPKYDSRDNCNAIIETGTNKLIQGCKDTCIPNTVTSIGENAFWCCSGLTSVTIPNSVTSIGVGAFHECSDLTSVTIPNSVTSIGNYAFGGCKLKEVSCLAVKVPSTGSNCFYDVPQSTATLYVPSSSVSAYKNASQWKDFGSILPISIPATGISLNQTSATLTNKDQTLQLSATIIPSDATNKSVTWSSSNTAVATVSSTGLVTAVASGSATITATTADGSNITATCTVMVSIPNGIVIDGISYILNSTTQEATVTYTGIEGSHESSYTGNINIPSTVTYNNLAYSVTSIGEYAFYECSSLTSVNIPESVTSIGIYAFSGCSDLTNLTIKQPENTDYDITSDISTYLDRSFMYVYYKTQNKWYALNNQNEYELYGVYGTDKSTGYEGKLVVVDEHEWEYSQGNWVDLGSIKTQKVNSIGKLTEGGKNYIDLGLHFSDKMRIQIKFCPVKAGGGAILNDWGKDDNTDWRFFFYGSTLYYDFDTSRLYTSKSLNKIYEWEIGNYYIKDIVTNTNILKGTAHSNFSNRDNNMLINGGSGDLTRYYYVKIFEGETLIRDLEPYYDGAAYGLWDKITGHAFMPIGENWEGEMEEHEVWPKFYIVKESPVVVGLASIDDYAFDGCSGLTSITIPSSVTSIGEGAFRNCNSLTSVTSYASQVPETSSLAFQNVSISSATLYVLESSVDSYKTTTPWSWFGTILPIPLSGDANGNGEVEIGDVTSVLTLMATPEATGYDNKAADANCNGEIEIGDVTTILTIMAKGE